METVIEEVVDSDDLKKFELAYKSQEVRGSVAEKTQFEYAWCLVRSRYQNDTKSGILLLEDLFKNAKDDHAKRDYMFYLAIGYTRLKKYEKALELTKAILNHEPGNRQAQDIDAYVNKKLKKDGLVGMAIVGGAAAVVFGGILTVAGLAISKKK